MKVGSKLIFLFRDPDGFGAAIYKALQANPNSSLQRSESSFELSLESYGIKDQKACGDIVHFVDNNGLFQVSVLLMQHYDVPILACAINEVLESIAGENPSPSLTLILPFVVPSSKVKSEDKSSPMNTEKSPLWVTQIGPQTEFIEAIISKTQKLPSSVQIYYEPLACLLQFVRILKFPIAILIVQSGQHVHSREQEEYEVICEMGELLASSCSLYLVKEGLKLSPNKTLKAAEEPWRALYG